MSDAENPHGPPPPPREPDRVRPRPMDPPPLEPLPGPVSRRKRARGAAPTSFHFSVGEVLARSFATYGRHFPALATFAFVVFAPLIVWSLFAASNAWSAPPEGEIELFGETLTRTTADFWERFAQESGILGGIIALVIPFLLQATVTLGVFQFLRGDHVDYGRSFSRGMARFLPVLGAALLTWLIVIGVSIVAGIAMVAVVMATDASIVAAVLGMLVIVVAVAAVFTLFLVAPQAVVVERVGPARAMSRSAWLTKGARWKVFGILLLFGIFGGVVQLVIQSVVWESPASETDALIAVFLQFGVSALIAALQAVTTAVVYHDLRRAKEGVSVDQLVQVFE